jgi:transcriptional regulator with XRE-family HTH domain
MSLHQLELDRHHELATFLRSRRARLSPEQAGLPRGTRRRTPGLRRGEVATLAGVSPEWYTWLEQGRDIHVSVQVLESLANALRLDENERAHIFLLALNQPPPVTTFTPPIISPITQQFLDQMTFMPACIADARLNVIAGNAAFQVVFGGDANQSERERNLVWRLFTARPGFTRDDKEWAKIARVYLGQFRARYGRFINDPWWAAQIAELSRISPEFRELWADHDVQNISEGHKRMDHPLAGELHFDFLWVQTGDAGDLRMLIHTPNKGTETAEKIQRLLEKERK